MPMLPAGMALIQSPSSEDLILRDAARGKDLALRITYSKADGKFPLILFSHCAGGKRDDFRPLAAQWASHGYVVVQMYHARMGIAAGNWQHRVTESEVGARLACRDWPPGAHSGVPDGRKTASERPGTLIGAYAVCALVGMKGERFGPGSEGADFSDPRIDAALLLSPQGRGQGLTETSWEEIRAPMLVAAGSGAPSLRTSNPPEWRAEPYRFAKPGDKYLLWIEGNGQQLRGPLARRRRSAARRFHLRGHLRVLGRPPEKRRPGSPTPARLADPGGGQGTIPA